MAPVLSASAWVMLARGVVGPGIDTGEESCPAPTSPTRPCSTNWPPPQLTSNWAGLSESITA
jgi:hypothetical protein